MYLPRWNNDYKSGGGVGVNVFAAFGIETTSLAEGEMYLPCLDRDYKSGGGGNVSAALE